MMPMGGEEEEVECEPCKVAAGVGVLLNICKKVKNLDCDKLEEKVLNEEMTPEDLIETILRNTDDKKIRKAVEEIRRLMYGKGRNM